MWRRSKRVGQYRNQTQRLGVYVLVSAFLACADSEPNTSEMDGSDVAPSAGQSMSGGRSTPSVEPTKPVGGSGENSISESDMMVDMPTMVGPVTPPSSVRPEIKIDANQLLVNGLPFHIKGVNWNPVAKGKVHPQDLDFAGFVEQDSALMAQAGINAVRTFEPITDVKVLDTLWSRGIYVLNMVYPWGGAPIGNVVEVINSVKDHPAILMWVVGNEWNYNGLYTDMGASAARDRVRDVVDLIKETDDSRPVATVYGEMPDPLVIRSLPNVDIWGLNVYRGIDFGDLFAVWRQRSRRPMFLAEYGADAYNTNEMREDQVSQAEATTVLTNQINANSSIKGGICLGGAIFEFADEWHKDQTGDPNVHDTSGDAPGGGPHPDGTFNEEWWGLVDIDRTPREAFRAYSEINIPTP